MVKIINPFRGTDPVALTIAAAGKRLTSGAMSPLEIEKFKEEQMKNGLTEDAMKFIAENGLAAAATDPRFAAMGLGIGWKPDDVGGYGRLGSSMRDPMSTETTNWNAGLGEYDKAPAVVQHNLDVAQKLEADKLLETKRNNDLVNNEKLYEFGQKPVETLIDGNPVFTPQSDVFKPGVAPILSDTDRKGTIVGRVFDGGMGGLTPEQKTYLGANPGSGEGGTPKNYVVKGPDGLPRNYLTRDGMTDLQTGQPLPPGGYIATAQGSATDVGLTNAGKTQVQNGLIANRKFNALLDMADPLTKDPSLFGPVGFIRSKAQDILQSINGVKEVAGAKLDLEKNLTDEAGNLLGPEAAKMLLPELYDPRLSEVETLWGLIVYSGAASLAGQENRSISDKDVAFMREILGDPHSFFASNKSMAVKLGIARKVVGKFDEISREALGGEAPVKPAGPVTPEPAYPVVKAAPAIGYTFKGPSGSFRFKGGDPNVSTSWEKVTP